MNSYPDGTAVTITIPFLDLNGVAVAPSALSYQVLDETETIVQATTSVALTDGAAEVSITIDGAVNKLPAPVQYFVNGAPYGNPTVTTTGIREVQLSMLTAAGVLTTKVQYLIRASDAQLILMGNSFQVYNLSLITASMQPNLNAWPLATEQERINAMVIAWQNLTKLGYFVRWPRDPDAQNYLNWYESRNEVIIPRLWSVMSPARWFSYYPEIFRAAMRQAQVVEADQIMYNDPILNRRLSGIFSEKIGESSTMLRSQKPLDLGISRQALACIQGFVDLRMKLSRV